MTEQELREFWDIRAEDLVGVEIDDLLADSSEKPSKPKSDLAEYKVALRIASRSQRQHELNSAISRGNVTLEVVRRLSDCYCVLCDAAGGISLSLWGATLLAMLEKGGKEAEMACATLSQTVDQRKAIGQAF